MRHTDPERAPIDSLQRAMGTALDEAIDKAGGKVAFARKAGLSRATLYRLLAGENVSSEVLLRTLRALGRHDVIATLIAPPEPSPLELRPATKKRTRHTRTRCAPAGALVAQLNLGQLPTRETDG